MLNWKVVSSSLAVFTAVSFVVCVTWGLLLPETLHMHALLEQLLPAFHWISPGSFLLGLIESALYGVYAGLLYVPVHNFFQRLFVKEDVDAGL